MALAELIDNSIQARSTCIDVLVERDEGDSDGLHIAVVDDGQGMDEATLSEALRFGGSTRFDNREGQGRFGMGLPNASVSQARHVEVFTWSDPRFPISTALDADALAEARTRGIPHPKQTKLPRWVRPYAASRGTAIVWTRCDRIQFRRAGMLTRHLHREFGRVFRRFLARGLSLQINGEPVALSDPVRIIPGPQIGENVIELPLMTFPFADPSSPKGVAVVEVRFAILPLESWTELSTEQKRSHGIANGAAVSIVRADREIALGWHLLGSKKRENYDDWWRCEIAFPPSLDELFGVTHSKQGIRPTPQLVDALAPSLEAQARRLNREVRDRFESFRQLRSDATRLAEQLHHKVLISGTPSRRHARAEVARTRYRITTEESSRAQFADIKGTAGAIEVALNTHHPFYRAIYEPLRAGASASLVRSFDLWLLALGRALTESAHASDNQVARHFLADWSDAAALLLEGK